MKRNKINRLLAVSTLLAITNGVTAIGGQYIPIIGAIPVHAEETGTIDNEEDTSKEETSGVIPMTVKNTRETQSKAVSGTVNLDRIVSAGNKFMFTNNVYRTGSYACNYQIYSLDSNGDCFVQSMADSHSTTYDQPKEMSLGNNMKITGGGMQKGWEYATTYVKYMSRNHSFSGSFGGAKYTGITTSARADGDGIIWAVANGKLYQCTSSSGTVKFSGVSGELREIDTTKEGSVCFVTTGGVYCVENDGTRRWLVSNAASYNVYYSAIQGDYYVTYGYSGNTIEQVKYSLKDGSSTVKKVSFDKYGTSIKLSNLTGSENIDDKQYDGFVAFTHGTDGSTIIKLDNDLNVKNAYSLQGVKIGGLSYNGKRCLGYVSSGKPTLVSGYVNLSMDYENKQFDPVYQTYSNTFNYNTSSGSATSTNVSTLYNCLIEPNTPKVEKDTFNYKVLDHWQDADGNVINSESIQGEKAKTYTAVYKDSEDSFWVDNNRYGIINEEKKTVCFLGSKNNNATIPTTVMYNGSVYTVSTIQKGSLSRETEINTLTVPSKLVTYQVFQDSKELKEVKITGEYSISSYAFKNCKNLESVDLSSYKGKNIYEYAFYDCSKLKSLKLPDSVDYIDKDAFGYCSSLENIDLSNIKTIGEYAFTCCSNLVSVDAEKLTSIGSNSFYGCSKLKQIKSNKAIVQSTSLSNSGFDYRAYFYDADEVTSLGAYWCKSGANLYDIQEKPLKEGYEFLKWERIGTTNSTSGNIVDNCSFAAKYDSEMNKQQVSTVTITGPDTFDNRCSYAYATLSGKSSGADYYYTLDGSEPVDHETEVCHKVNGSIIDILAPDTDSAKRVVLQVSGFKNGYRNSEISTKIVVFKAYDSSIQKVTNPTLTPSKTNAENREENVTVNIG